MLACREGGATHFEVQVGRGVDRDRVDLGSVEQGRGVVRREGDLQARGLGCGPFGTPAPERRDLPAGRPEGVDRDPRPPARAQHSHTSWRSRRHGADAIVCGLREPGSILRWMFVTSPLYSSYSRSRLPPARAGSVAG